MIKCAICKKDIKIGENHYRIDVDEYSGFWLCEKCYFGKSKEYKEIPVVDDIDLQIEK